MGVFLYFALAINVIIHLIVGILIVVNFLFYFKEIGTLLKGTQVVPVMAVY